MMLDVSQILVLLKEHQLLKETFLLDKEAKFEHIAYDSRKVSAKTLFFCKGNFQPKYLQDAQINGATAYIAQQAYASKLPAIIVTDVQKAMALLSAAFYDYPQNELFVLGITGTKGKTTTAYMAYEILKRATQNKTALFSTVDRILGPKCKFKSDLTTPESLDLFHDMRIAVDNGMTHLIMEVSSQAYKKNRVYGLKYDVGVFLNISSDHIGENEHPDFADYLYCKEQLLKNSEICVINAQSAYLQELLKVAQSSTAPDKIFVFSNDRQVRADIYFESESESLQASQISLTLLSHKAQALELATSYLTSVPGDYNESNAVAAILATYFGGASATDARTALPQVKIAGRMEVISSKHHGTICVDYAHNYASLKALLVFIKHQQPQAKITVVLSSAGNKGISRRKDLGRALNEEAQCVILTTDDPGYEDPHQINQAIAKEITTPQIQVSEQLDRSQAIRQAILQSQAQDVVVLAGKGEDPYQKIKGHDVFYAGDVNVVKQILEEIEDEHRN